MIGLKPTFDDATRALVDVGSPLLRQRFKPRHCIAASRLATTVLRACGHGVRPVPTWALAKNRPFAEAMDATLDPARWGETGVRIVEISVDGAEYPAHLVVVSNGYLFDLSAGQFDRPHKQIRVGDALRLPVPEGWSAGGEMVGAELADGGRFLYRPLRDVRVDYRQAADWDPDRTDDIAQCVLDAL